jgi:hypothetical protein
MTPAVTWRTFHSYCALAVLWARVRYWIPAQLSSLHGRKRPAPTLHANTCKLGAEAGPQSAGFVEKQDWQAGRLLVVHLKRPPGRGGDRRFQRSGAQ